MSDDLVERVAEALRRNSLVEMDLPEPPWAEVPDDLREYWLKRARVALAIIEPAVRQECIAIASRWSRDGQSATAHGIIEGIREGAKP